MAFALIDYEAVARGNSSSDLDLRHCSGVIIFSTVYANAMGFTTRRPADWLGWMCPSEPLTGRHGYLRSRRQDEGAHMKKLALFAALLMATSPVAAQSAQQALGAAGTTNNSLLPNTGIICEEEMTATFCNVSTGPNNAGYGTNAGAAATSAGITTPSPAIPTCSNFPPADELCN